MVEELASRSRKLYRRARELIPGGVNSPVRSYLPYPLFVASAKGSRFRTVDGGEYLDYCMAYGALLDGHRFQEVSDAVKKALEKGWIYGQPTEIEVELAEEISRFIPSMEMVRLANSGTEATMHAVRLARGFTKRNKILKFQGGFHGSHDSVLVQAGSRASLIGVPASEGIPKETVKNTLVARYNDEKTATKIIRDHRDELAAVIVEPVMGNMGPIPPNPGFLEALRRETWENKVLLIFDETITGFRLALGGAQEHYKVQADLTTLAKILGGGLPLAAFGGRRDIMEKLAPLGAVYQAGTYSGNPVSVSAGLATLRSLRRRAGHVYPELERRGEELRRGITDLVQSIGLKAQVNGVASMFQIFFTERPVVDYHSAKSSDIHKFQKYFQTLLASRVFIPPSQFETCFLSTVHTPQELEVTLDAVGEALKKTGQM